MKSLPTGNQLLKALGREWKRDLDLLDAADKMADRVVQVPRKYAIVMAYLPEYLDGGKSVLDVSCGAGVFLEVMRHFGNQIHGTCLNMFSMMSSQQVPFTEHDSTQVPFPFEDQSFDLVSCFGSIKQFKQNRQETFHEFFRMARQTVIVDVNSPASADGFRRLLDTQPTGWNVQHIGKNVWKYERV